MKFLACKAQHYVLQNLCLSFLAYQLPKFTSYLSQSYFHWQRLRVIINAYHQNSVEWHACVANVMRKYVWFMRKKQQQNISVIFPLCDSV